MKHKYSHLYHLPHLQRPLSGAGIVYDPSVNHLKPLRPIVQSFILPKYTSFLLFYALDSVRNGYDSD